MKKGFFFSVLAIIFFVGIVWALFLRQEKPPQKVEISSEVSKLLEEKEQTQTPDIIGEGQPKTDAADAADKTDEKPVPAVQPSDSSVEIRQKVFIDVPFVVQAPNANWDYPYSEACEEASVVMVDAFYRKRNITNQDEMKSAIDGIVYWGDNRFGSFDTSAEDTALYFTEKLGYENDQVVVIYDMTIDDMKALLSKGYPIIVPVAGRKLGNEFFQTPGPLYHMLVIVGYESDQFITNDPGTRRGEGYRYDQNILYAAIHDLTPVLEEIETGRKAMIVVKP